MEMVNPAGKVDPEKLPFQIEDEIGEILLADQPYPGVYYVAAKKDEADSIAAEYYIVLKDTLVISQAVKNYGQAISDHPELLVYPLVDDRSGWRLVDYEGLKYLIQNHLQLPEQMSLHETAVYSMEYHPEYFGAYPVPLITPAGYTLRHKELCSGVYWLETDRCEQMLTVCYPIWSSELSEAALSLSQQTEYDQTHGIDTTFGYIFFSKRDSCVPLFELLRVRKGWAGPNHINVAALMNAIWNDFPEYAMAHNLREQSGNHDLLGQLMNELGIEVELNGSPENMIAMAPPDSTDFICW